MPRTSRLLQPVAGLLLALGAGAPLWADIDRTVLPIRPPPFDGRIAPHVHDAQPGSSTTVRAPTGAPNIFLFMADDAGFAMSSTFGGPVPTPNMDRVAARGQRYNRFHTTGICSPSRASLLTGRNHHAAGVGYLSDIPADFPGYGGRILPETSTIAQVLRLNGYSTAMFGKHHNVPSGERSEAGPFDAWPTSLGFDYFFGFVSGDTDQYQPSLFRGISRVSASEGEGPLLEQRLANDIIRWVHNQKAGAPDRPFMAYYAPGSPHAPQQAPSAVIARFKGQFDRGWDAMRGQSYRRQIAMGMFPKSTRLTPRPDGIPAWTTLSTDQRAFSARTMEVAAAALAYQDEQLGRVLDEFERMGELEKTLVVIVQGDNGASAEAGHSGSINELRGMSTHDEDPEWLIANIDHLGSAMTYGNYPAGWAWAMNTPLRWTKQYASMLGGIRNGMILSWPGHVAKPGSVCGEFSHLVDIAPTVLDAIGLPAPRVVLGAEQKPINGQSLLPSLTLCEPDRPRTQYFEIGGKIGFYRNGWFLSGDDRRVPWEALPPEGEKPMMRWGLYNLAQDYSQFADLAPSQPARLSEMVRLFEAEARRNNVYPLDHRFATARGGRRGGAGATAARNVFHFWGKDVSTPATSDPILFARSFTLDADLQLDRSEGSGVVAALGSRFGGWSLYLDQGYPVFVFARSTDPKEIWTARTKTALPAGSHKLTLRFVSLGRGKGAEVALLADGTEVARLNLPVNFLMPAGGGETFDVGRDLGVPVTTYRKPQGPIEGDVPHIVVTFD
jgi:arylsulfatase A-like enzyme